MAINPPKFTFHSISWVKVLMLLLILLGGADSFGQEPSATPPPKSTGVQEDVNEFLGYEDLLLVRYISLPYDVIMNTNMASYFVDLGFLLIIFIPLIYLVSSRISWLHRLGFLMLCIIFLLLSVPSAYLNKHQLSVENGVSTLSNEQAEFPFSESPLVATAYQLKKPFLNIYSGLHTWLEGISGPTDGITYPILFLLFIPVFLLLDKRIRHHDTGTRVSIHFLLLFSFLWLILSSGISWYGLLMIPLLFLFTVAGMTGSEAQNSKLNKIFKGLLLGAAGIWIIIAFTYRFSNYDPSGPEMAKFVFMANVSEYQTGRKDLNNVFDRAFPQYRKAMEYLNREDESYIYRVGTPLPFFIDKNDRRVISDNFLDFFNNLNREFPNNQELASALKAYGVRYIIIDLNLAANDHTAEGSLRTKFQQFSSFLYQNPQLQLIATDRILRGPDGTARFGIFKEEGTVIEHWGWFAVLQII